MSTCPEKKKLKEYARTKLGNPLDDRSLRSLSSLRISRTPGFFQRLGTLLPSSSSPSIGRRMPRSRPMRLLAALGSSSPSLRSRTRHAPPR